MRAFVLLLVVCLVGCRPFLDIEADGTCGNGVLEPAANEDCDTFADDDARCGSSGLEACHYVCDDATTCPAGFSCGNDHICRRPSGTFAAPSTLAMNGMALMIADFDGDGRDDIASVGTSSLDAAYADGDGVVRAFSSMPIALPDRAAAAPDLDRDGRADVILPMSGGMQLLRGTSARSFLPVVPPVDVRTGAQSVTAVGVATSAPFLLQDALYAGVVDGAVRFALRDRSLVATEVESRLANANAFHLAVEQQSASTARVGVAVTGATEVLFGSVACNANSCTMPLVETVSLPARNTIAGRFFLADVEGDGHTDAVMYVRRDGGTRLAVVSGSASGFGEVEFPPALQSLLQCASCVGDEVSLQGVADVTGDGAAEFILRDRIVQTDGTRQPLVVARASRPWRTSVIADVNDDGFLDVVGVGPFALEVLVSRGDGLFNARQVGAGANAYDVTAGDFDGDLATDIAILDTNGLVSVLFSNEGILAGDTAVVGQFAERSRVVTVRDANSGDGIDDLLVVNEGSDPIVALARGTSARHMQTLIPKQGRSLAAVVAGRFRSDTVEVLDVEVLGSAGPPTVQLSLISGDSLGTSVAERIPLRAEGCTLPTDFDVDAAVHDFDGDGRDEIVLTQGFRTAPAPQVGQPAERPILVARIVDDRFVCVVNTVINDVLHPDQIVIADFDNDGDDDLVVALVLHPEEGVLDAPRVSFARYTNTDGTLETTPALLTVDGITDFNGSVRALRGGTGAELVALLDDVLFALRVDGEFVEQRPIVDVAAGSVRSLGIGDVNGDGLDDLVVGSNTAALLYLQVACAAGGACP